MHAVRAVAPDAFRRGSSRRQIVFVHSTKTTPMPTSEPRGRGGKRNVSARTCGLLPIAKLANVRGPVAMPPGRSATKRVENGKRRRVAVHAVAGANTNNPSSSENASHQRHVPRYRVTRWTSLPSMGKPFAQQYNRDAPSDETEPRARFVPALGATRRKGQSGRIAVIGGCAEYTGAPYFAGIAALKTGADLVHVFCTEGAGAVVKGYSPDLIVHPYLREIDELRSDELSVHIDDWSELQRDHMLQVLQREQVLRAIVAKTNRWLANVDAIVIGPGLGRDVFVQAQVCKFFEFARDNKIPLVVDADGLFLVSNDPELVRGNPNVVFTPNANELNRLCKAVLGTEDTQAEKSSLTASSLASTPEERLRQRGELCKSLSLALGGVAVLSKGDVDVGVCAGFDRLRQGLPGELESDRGIDADKVKEFLRQRRVHELDHALGWFGNSQSGCPRRCGGQGDVLAGTLAVFLAWASRARYDEYVEMSAQLAAALDGLENGRDVGLTREREKNLQTYLSAVTRRNFVDGQMRLATSNQTLIAMGHYPEPCLDAATLSVAEKSSAMWHASMVTRHASSAAFMKKKRAMVTADVVEALGVAFEFRFPAGLAVYETQEEKREAESWSFGNLK